MLTFNEFMELYFNKARNIARNDNTVIQCCKGSKKFLWWFENKYLKWEYDKADIEDIQCLYDGLVTTLEEIEEGD